MRSALWLAAVVAVLAAAASSAAMASELRVGVSQLPADLDPAIALDGPVPLIARQVFDTLVQYADSSSEVEPGLAAQWAASKDGLVWAFRLREGVSFHDGTPLSAARVVESLSREILPGHPRAPAGSVAGRLLRGAPGVVRQIRSKDARTVEIVLSQP